MRFLRVSRETRLAWLVVAFTCAGFAFVAGHLNLLWRLDDAFYGIGVDAMGPVPAPETVIRIPGWATGLLMAMLVLGLMTIMLRTRPRATLLVVVGFVALLLFGVWGGLLLMHVWIPPSAGIIAAMIAFPLWSWRRLEATRRYFDVELEALRYASGFSGSSGASFPQRRDSESFLDHITVLRDAARRQQDLQRSRDETIHFLSHDLRSPLASIVMSVEVLRATRSDRNERDTEMLERIERQASAALALAENLVRLARAEEIDPLCFSRFGLEMIVQDAADEVWAPAHDKQLTLRTDLSGVDDGDGCEVLGDADLLRRAIVNLLNNAIKYTPHGGSIDLRLRRGNEGWLVEVEDSGVGISADQQSMLFRRFSRLRTEENSNLQGIGLGLLMVRAVAECHGGSVTVRSVQGEGSTFTLSLPAAPREGND